MVRSKRFLLRLVPFLVLTRYQCSADPQRSPNELSLFITQPFVPEEGELVEHQTTLGSVTGRKEPTMGLHRSNTHYYAFRGIPYAKPPVGNLRLEDPVEVKGRWPGGHLNASQYQPACPQYSVKFNLVLGDEDCLYLNVFTPKLPEAASGGEGLPVFVYIHGGGFLRGSSLWLSAARFTAHQVVFVTFNYRLGALGFLSTGDRTIPGNYGSLDQIAALRWVNSHIAQFGGDPSKVTLGGFSAGSASAHLFMISPRAKGLFQKAILMSGTVHGCWSVKDQPHRYATQLANKLGCPLTSSAHVRSCISAKPYQEVIRAQASMLRYTFWPMPYTIVIDAGLRDDPVLPAPVRSLTPTMPMPVLISTVPHDGLKFALQILTSTTEPRNPAVSYEEATRYTISSFWFNVQHAEHVAHMAETLYYSSRARYSLDTLLEEMSEALTDYMFLAPSQEAAASLAAANCTVYNFIMTHRDSSGVVWGGPHLFEKASDLGMKTPLLKTGVSHGDEQLFLLSSQEYNYETETFSSSFVSLFVNFISRGRPQGVEGERSEWTPVVAGELVGYYNISLQPSMVHTPYNAKGRNFWLQTIPLLETFLETGAASHPADVKDEL